MIIYFAGAIRGGREDAKTYHKIIKYLNNKHQILTEHIGNPSVDWQGEIKLTNREIYIRDMDWLKEAKAVIAEVSTPSLGVGYELAIAEKLAIPVLCLYKFKKDKSISAMILGNNYYYYVQGAVRLFLGPYKTSKSKILS